MMIRQILTPALAALSLFGASAALADVDLPIPKGCLVPELEIEDAAKTLKSEGWVVQEIPTPRMFDALGWVGMPQYFAGDSGGADMDYVYEIKRRNAIGFAKLKDVPSSRSRILSRGTNETLDVLLLQWTDHHTYRFSLVCSIALAIDHGTDLREKAGLDKDHDDFHTLPFLEETVAGANLKAYTYILNDTKISEKLGAKVATGAVILTHLNFAEGDA